METWLREEASGSWGLGCNTGSQEERLALGLHGQLRPLQEVWEVSSLTDLVAAGSSAGYLVGVVENGTGEDGDPR